MKIDNGMKNGWGIGSLFMELFYPRVCEVCGRSLIQSETYFCSYCLSDFPFADQNFAMGREILGQFEEYCRPKRLFALYYYDKYSPYKHLIHLIKYSSYQNLGFYLGQMLGEKMKMESDFQIDGIVPVPLHKKREKQRGFNQALEIAKGINTVLQVELLENVIVRKKNNVSQTGKNSVERMNNVVHIFELIHPEQIKERHILVVDDVITTGATIGSCLKELVKAGEVAFTLACLAKTL